MRVGIDFGGTKIEGIQLDAEGQECARKRIATPHSYAEALDAVVALVHDLEASSGFGALTVGVGIPGALSPTKKTIKNANSTFLIGQAFDVDLQARLGRPVRLENDANCLAVSEAVDGAGQYSRVVFGVILGTGCGGGVAIDGVVHAGPNAIAGEWGHNPLPWPSEYEEPGALCYCGRRGCLETWLSGPALSARYRERSKSAHRNPDDSGLSRAEEDTREPVEPTALPQRAAEGDLAAQQCLAQHEACLARGLALVANTLDPDVIVVGGGLSPLIKAYPRLGEGVAAYAFGEEFNTPIRIATHGDSSGIRGAAWLFPA